MTRASGILTRACVLVLLVASFGIASEKGRPPLLTSAYEIQFDRQLGLPGALRLHYTNDARFVDFRCEFGSEPVRASALHLFLEHSPQLNPDRSFLSVSLNYGLLRSLRLDATNQGPTEIVIPLPPNLLRRNNRLILSVEQHYLTGSALGSIWTSILGRSYITIHSEPVPAAYNLRELPLPLFDPGSYQPKVFDVLLPQRIAQPTLEATALLVANLAHRVATEPVTVNVVRSIAEAKHPLLIVGTSYEQPELWSVEAAAPVDGEEGFVGISRSLAGSLFPILFVTGGSPDGVLRAARKLALTAVSGNLVKVVADTRYQPAAQHAWEGFIPPNGHFQVGDLGIEELTLGPEDDYTLALPLRAPPDFRFFPKGAQMTLQFQMAPGFSSLPRRLIVDLNGARLQDLGVSGMVRDSLLSLTMNVPGSLLRSQNLLTISLPAQRPTAEPPPTAVLLPNSQFSFPFDYGAELPDLGLLRFHLYPFSRSPDLSDLVIAVPRVVDRGIFEAAVELASKLGRLAPADRLDFHVRQIGAFPERERNASQVISLGAIPSVGLTASVVLREEPSEWDRRKFVLAIDATSTAALKPAIEEFFAEPGLNRLTGDTAYMTAQGMSCLITARKRNIGEILLLLHVEVWLRTDWLALPAILTAISAVLFVAWRIALERYKSSRSARWQEGD